MTIVWVNASPFTESANCLRPDMIWGGLLVESFAGLLQKLTIWWVSECFVEVDARFRGVLIRNTNIGTERQLISTAAWKGDQPTLLDISGQTLWSWKVHCTSVKSNGGKSTRKFEDFIANPSGHRPSRRLKTCNSTKNYKLNNTPIETHQNIYLVGFYG